MLRVISTLSSTFSNIKLTSISMSVTPPSPADDGAYLQRVGIVLLSNLAELSTLTLLHGNDATICPVALTKL